MAYTNLLLKLEDAAPAWFQPAMDALLTPIRTNITKILTDIAEIRTDIAEIRTNVAKNQSDLIQIRIALAQVSYDILFHAMNFRLETANFFKLMVKPPHSWLFLLMIAACPVSSHNVILS